MRAQFIRRANSWYYHSDEVEKTLSKVIGFARARGNHDLVRDALLLQAECFFRKRRSAQQINWCTTILDDDAGLFSE